MTAKFLRVGISQILFCSCLVMNSSLFAQTESKEAQSKTGQTNKNTSADFWSSLKELSGKSFEGKVIHAPEGDETFAGKSLTMTVRPYETDLIQIHFFVGEDRSRTWVLKKLDDRILLKHDHRHEDGTADEITNYGGLTSNRGSTTRQVFPADQETVDMLPAAVSNVWWIDVVSGEHYTYNLRRVGTDRYFSVKFDLSNEVEGPPTAWGWEK